MTADQSGFKLTAEQVAELRTTFLDQAAEFLEEIDRQALALEHASEYDALLAEIRRAVHTIKGDAGAIGFPRVAGLAHRLEDGLDTVPDEVDAASLATLLLDWTSMVRRLLPEEALPEGEVEAALESALARFHEVLASRPAAGNGPPPATPAPGPAAPAPGTWRAVLTFDPRCRLRTAGAALVGRRLEPIARVVAAEPAFDAPAIETCPALTLVLQDVTDPEAVRKACAVGGVVCEVALDRADEGVPAAPPPHARIPTAPAPTPAVPDADQGPRRIDTVRVDAARLEQAMALVGELAIARGEVGVGFAAFAARLGRDAQLEQLEASLGRLDRSLRDLQKTVLGTRLVPVDLLFRRLPRVVREVALALGREVRLVQHGGDTALDKSLVDALAEPVLHMVRNAIAHGLEPPAARRAAGKPPEGCLTLRAAHVGNQIVLEIEDDGRGIDQAAVGRRAVERGLVTPDALAAMSDAQRAELIFVPGLSTASEVTAVSGRGIGMDVVRQTVARLHGRVQVESIPGAGARFTLRLPLTLAIQKVFLVWAAGERYALSLTSVLELVRAPGAGFETVEGVPVLRLRDAVLPLLRLADVVPPGRHARGAGGPPATPPERRRGGASSLVAVLTDGERRFGLIVDALAGEQELVIKALGDRLAATPLASGAAVLGDGRAVLILDPAALAGRLAAAHLKARGAR